MDSTQISLKNCIDFFSTFFSLSLLINLMVSNFFLDKMVLMNEEHESHDALSALLNISDKIKFFNNLSKEDITTLISDVKITSFKYGDVIFNEKSVENDHLFYMIRGKVAISKYLHGSSSIKTMVTVIDEPSLFGEMMRFTGKPRSATVESLDNKTLVIEFKLKDFNETTPLARFYKNVICELSEKLNHMNDQYC